MQTITFIIGLPGSGKTTYLKENIKKLENAVIFDDYYKDTGKKSPHFSESIFYKDLQESLLEGKNIILTDIVFCKKRRLKETEKSLKELLEKLSLTAHFKHLYFENNPQICKNNVKVRDRTKRTERELEYIDRVSPAYTIPQNVKILPIVRGK